MTEELNVPNIFEGKIDVSHVLSILMDFMGGSARIPADQFTKSMVVDRKLVLSYDDEEKVFILTLENISPEERAQLENK